MQVKKHGRRQSILAGFCILLLCLLSACGTKSSLPWNLVLVNADEALPESFTCTLLTLSNGQQVDERMYPALQAAFDAARAEGIDPCVVSGFRTADDQQSILEERAETYKQEGHCSLVAELAARKWVALPGHSEHQTGLAVDVGAAPESDNYDWQVYTWMAENGWRYGFVLRYPSDKADVTGISGEAWHFRYVGESAAAEMHEQGLCLEEYLDR